MRSVDITKNWNKPKQLLMCNKLQYIFKNIFDEGTIMIMNLHVFVCNQ